MGTQMAVAFASLFMSANVRKKVGKKVEKKVGKKLKVEKVKKRIKILMALTGPCTCENCFPFSVLISFLA